MSNYTKGAKGEREVLDLFDGWGFVGLRAPSSGSTTERELPDVLIGNNGYVLAIEVKRPGGDYLYLEEEEVEDLMYFSEMFGAEHYIGVRFDYGRDWFFFREWDMHQTDSGRYRIKKENVNKGKKVSDIL